MDLSKIFASLENINLAGLTLAKVLSAVLLLVICLIAVKLILKIFDKLIKRVEMERSLYIFIRTFIKIILLFVVVLIVAGFLGIPVTSLIAVLSVFGLAISLAVQNSLSNVAGGIQILTSKPFKAGDYVEAGGIAGTVTEVGIFYTKIDSSDNKLIQVPNSQIAAEKIINYTAEAQRRVDLKFTASYDAPVETVKTAIQGVIGAHPLILFTPKPFVRVSNYGDSAIEYTVRVWCATEDYWTVYFDLMEQVKEAFDQANVEMTYPHVNVHMMKED